MLESVSGLNFHHPASENRNRNSPKLTADHEPKPKVIMNRRKTDQKKTSEHANRKLKSLGQPPAELRMGIGSRDVPVKVLCSLASPPRRVLEF